jgi:hypothetical protein
MLQQKKNIRKGHNDSESWKASLLQKPEKLPRFKSSKLNSEFDYVTFTLNLTPRLTFTVGIACWRLSFLEVINNKEK